MQARGRHRHVDHRGNHPAVDGFVRVGPLLGLPAVLCELGHEPGPIFESVGLSLSQFGDPDTEISYITAGRLLARSVAATQCQHFGLLVGESAPPSSLGVAGFLLQSAPIVGTALHDLAHNLVLHDQGGSATLNVRCASTLFGYDIHLPIVEATDQIYDLAIAIACNIMRSLCGRNWSPSEVLLSRQPPWDLAPYKRVFRAPLRFNAEQNAIVFPSRLLEHRIPGADPHLHLYLEKNADELHTLRNGNFVLVLRRLIRKSLLSGQCTETHVASQLCIHERTLHRRLRQEGTSFRQELDDVRYELARQLLTDSAMPVIRIATKLNYADTSAFSRAFRRWAGATPSQWRKLNAPSS